MTFRKQKPLPADLSILVIDALGGTKSVACHCHVTTAAVSQWRRFGIPPAQLRFLRERFKSNVVMKIEDIRRFP